MKGWAAVVALHDGFVRSGAPLTRALRELALFQLVSASKRGGEGTGS
jgi:hypothetical protein